MAAPARFKGARSRAGENADDFDLGPGKAIKFARAAECGLQHLAGRAHDAVGDQLLAKVALVERAAEYALIEVLQFGKRELRRDQLARDRGALQFCAQTAECRGRNFVVIVSELADAGGLAPAQSVR